MRMRGIGNPGTDGAGGMAAVTIWAHTTTKFHVFFIIFYVSCFKTFFYYFFDCFVGILQLFRIESFAANMVCKGAFDPAFKAIFFPNLFRKIGVKVCQFLSFRGK